MASGEDNRFSAIYTSIDGEDEYEEYEEYVEIASGPTAYLVPNRRGGFKVQPCLYLCSYKAMKITSC